MIIELGVILSIMAIAGTMLSLKKDRRCFLVWGFTNAGWLLWCAVVDGPASVQMLLWIAQLVACIYGYWKWGE